MDYGRSVAFLTCRNAIMVTPPTAMSDHTKGFPTEDIPRLSWLTDMASVQNGDFFRGVAFHE